MKLLTSNPKFQTVVVQQHQEEGIKPNSSFYLKMLMGVSWSQKNLQKEFLKLHSSNLKFETAVAQRHQEDVVKKF